MLEAAGAADKLAQQKAGEFYLVREGDVAPRAGDARLIPTEQLPKTRIPTGPAGRPRRQAASSLQPLGPVGALLPA